MVRKMMTAMLLAGIGIGTTGCLFAEPPTGSHGDGYGSDSRYYREPQYQRPYDSDDQRPAYWH